MQTGSNNYHIQRQQHSVQHNTQLRWTSVVGRPYVCCSTLLLVTHKARQSVSQPVSRAGRLHSLTFNKTCRHMYVAAKTTNHTTHVHPSNIQLHCHALAVVNLPFGPTKAYKTKNKNTRRVAHKVLLLPSLADIVVWSCTARQKTISRLACRHNVYRVWHILSEPKIKRKENRNENLQQQQQQHQLLTKSFI